MKLSILVPMRSTISTITVSSLMGVTGYTSEWAAKRGHEMVISTVSRAHCVGARNQLATAALTDEADWMLWLDDDSMVQPDVFERMLDVAEQQGADAVAALCFERGGAMKSPAGSFKDGRFERTMESGWIESTGFHCVLMNRRTLEAVRDAVAPSPIFQQPTSSNHVIAGEDRFFWAMAGKAGIKLWHEAGIEAGHICEVVLDTTTRPALLQITGKAE